MDAIFLHAGWRTAGTLFWHCLRAHHACKTFYEPLHESFVTIDAEAIGKTGSASWNSRHPASASSYFREYIPLLNTTSGRGISAYLVRFAFDDFFLSKTGTDDKLQKYIEGVCDLGRQDGRLPVLKFTRSLGRLPWFRAQFPQAIHPVIIRDPWSQFCSAWRARMESRNGYFLAVPFLIMERNSAAPEVAALAAALDLPTRFSPNTEPLARLEFWRVAVQRMPFEMLYRGSLALWLLNYSRALPEASFLLDMNAPMAELRKLFGGHTGIDLALETPPIPTAQPLQFYRRHQRPAAAMIRHAHDLAKTAMAPFVAAAVLNRLSPWIELAAARAEHDLNGYVLDLPGPSVGHSAGLALNMARRWVKSRAGFSLTN
jgi:hypothetical protein